MEKPHFSKMDLEAWVQHIQGSASTMLNDLIKWRNVPFNYAERYLDQEPLATSC